VHHRIKLSCNLLGAEEDLRYQKSQLG